MNTKHNLQSLKSTPTCFGTGLIALDIVINQEVKTVPKLWTGGSCGNVLTILSYLGWESYPIARLGKDTAAESIRQDLNQFKVKLDFLDTDARSSTPIIIEQICLGLNGTPKHRFKLECPSCGSWFPRYKPILVKKVSGLLDKVPSISTFYFDRVSPASIKLANAFRDKGALIVFEPSSIGNEKLFYKAIEVSHVLKYSSERLKDIDFLLQERASLLQVETLGIEGLRYRFYDKQGSDSWNTIPAFNIRNIRDTAGSGDWCTAGIIHLLGGYGSAGFENVLEEKIVEALKFGQALAALNCCFEGARGGMYAFTREDFRRSLEGIILADSVFDYTFQSSFYEFINELKYVCPICKKSWTNKSDCIVTEDKLNDMSHSPDNVDQFSTNDLNMVV